MNSWCVLFLHLQALRGLVSGEQAPAPLGLPALNSGYSIPMARTLRRSAS